MSLNFWSSSPHLLSAGITSVHYHTWFIWGWGSKPALSVLGKSCTNYSAISPTLILRLKICLSVYKVSLHSQASCISNFVWFFFFFCSDAVPRSSSSSYLFVCYNVRPLSHQIQMTLLNSELCVYALSFVDGLFCCCCCLLVLVVWVLFWDRVSLCRPGWPWTQNNPPASPPDCWD